MNNKLRTKKGFSLTEVLLAIGTLAIGMIFVGGVFPVAIHFTTIATERTIAAVAADEAFAKIRLIAEHPNPLFKISAADFPFNLQSFEVVVNTKRLPLGGTVIDPSEFAYPSTYTNSQKQYYWSALCRWVGLSDVQVTVFVSRKIGANARYWYRNPDGTPNSIGSSYPKPIYVEVSQIGLIRPDELLIIDGFVGVTDDGVDEETFINDGYTIVDNQTGDIYRVLERYAANDNVILLDRDWEGGLSGFVWVVPPPVGGGRYPCVAVYQKVIGF